MHFLTLNAVDYNLLTIQLIAIVGLLGFVGLMVGVVLAPKKKEE